jgi:hypothetical protein
MWLVSGVLAVGLVSVAVLCGRPSTPPPPTIGGTELKLQAFASVEGTDVFRAELRDNSGFSSGYGRTRNVAFIELGGQARWLLPDDDHVVSEHPVSREPQSTCGEPRAPVAIAALVEPGTNSGADGVALLYDPAGRTIRHVAEKVVAIHGVALSADQSIRVLYERPGQYIVATFDAATLAERAEVPVALPQLR